MKEGKFGIKEAISLVVVSISVKVFFTSPTVLTKLAGTSAWYLTILSSITAMVGFTVICSLLKRFPGSNLTTAFEQAMGRPMGFVFTMLLSIYLLLGSAELLREFAEVLKVYTLPLTPIGFVITAFVGMVIGACLFGLEAIARVASLFSSLLFGGFLLLIVLNTNNYDPYNLFPILGYGIGTTIGHGLARSSFYGEVVALGIISSSLHGYVHVRKAGYIGLAISGAITALALLAGLMAFNYSTAQEMVSQMYTLARIIRLSDFLQRLDPIFIFTWCLGTLISVSFTFYCSLSAYCKAFRIEDMRPLIIPTAILMFTTSLVPANIPEIANYVQLFRQYGWIIVFGLPLIALVSAALRGKRGVKGDA